MGEITRGEGERRRRRRREIRGREESLCGGSSFSRGVQIQHVEEESSSKSFKEKCSHLAKKQRAKFYILRRCITMLLCWHERNDP